MIEPAGDALKIPEDPKEAAALALSLKAMGVLTEWARMLTDGETVDLPALCRARGISHRQMMRQLKNDPKMQEEVFGAMAVEARLTLIPAFKTAFEVMTAVNEEGKPLHSPATKLMWAKFVAQWLGGAFEKREGTQVNIGVLIPELPAGLQSPNVIRVDHREVKTLDDLTH